MKIHQFITGIATLSVPSLDSDTRMEALERGIISMVEILEPRITKFLSDMRNL